MVWLPVLRKYPRIGWVDDRVVAAVDLKTDRQAGKLLVQKWTWLGDADAEVKAAIDAELGRFERFQLSS